MSIIRTTWWTGFSVGIRLLAGLSLNKILAILVGPGGYATIGQFQNAVQLIFTVCGGAINNGVTKFTAEYESDEHRQASLWSTATRIILIASAAMAVLLTIFNRPLAAYFLRDAALGSVFIWLAASITLFSLNTMLMAILNGKKDLRTYVFVNIGGSILILLAMAALTRFFGLYGALIAVATNQAVLFFLTLLLCRRKLWFRLCLFSAPFSRTVALGLFGFAVMAGVSAFANNGGQIAVPLLLVREFGTETAGLWDGMIKISQLNMMLVAQAMAFYFLPRIAELQSWEEIRAEIWQGGRFIVPLFAAAAVAAFILRDIIILTLFTREFLPMEELFAWQLAGDTVRVGSWFLAYVMIGKAMIRTYVATEVLTNAVFVVVSHLLVTRVGFGGVAIAHFLTYAAALVGMYVAVARNRALPRLIIPKGENR